LLDHDDLWDPEYLAEVDRFVTNHNIDVVWCNCRTLRETAQSATVTVPDRFRQHAPAGFWQTRGIAPDEHWSVLEHYGYRDYLTFHPPQPSVTSIRRDVYQRIGGFDPRLRNNNAENMEFELRAVRSARIGVIWRPLASITDHTASAGADTNKTIVDVVALLEFVLQHHSLTADETNAITEAIQQRLPRAINPASTGRPGSSSPSRDCPAPWQAVSPRSWKSSPTPPPAVEIRRARTSLAQSCMMHGSNPRGRPRCSTCC
jgi:hypothetical protein